MSSPDPVDMLASRKAYNECTETIATFRKGKFVEDGLKRASTSSLEQDNDSTSPDRPLKRSRDEEGDISSPRRMSSSPSKSTKPENDDAPSPSKRQKSEAVIETPKSTPETVQYQKKNVRFHARVVDNSLWAGLDWYKRKEEIRKLSSHHTPPPSPTQARMTQSPSSPLPTGPPPLNGSSPPKERRIMQTYREISCDRAKQFLAKDSWLNGNKFVVIDRRNDDEPDSEDETLISYLADSEIWPEKKDSNSNDDDDDDVSVPRSSPSPSFRILAMDVSAAEANQLQVELAAKRRNYADAELPSIFVRPNLSLLGTFSGKPMIRPIVESSKPSFPKPSFSLKEVSDHVAFLESALNRLPAHDTRKAFEALEAVTQFYSHSTFIEGLKQGVQAHQKATSQKSDTGSAS
ncbi:hypothetical protein ACEPAF_3501 [Sanghuangporus sanghuang]